MRARPGAVAVISGLAVLLAKCSAPESSRAPEAPAPSSSIGAPAAPPDDPVATEPADAATPASVEHHLLTARVTDASGAPVPGARVQALSSADTPRVAETDAAGIARLELAPWDGRRVRAETGDGRVTRWTGMQRIGGDDEANLVLLPGAILAGTVVESGSAVPLAGARVTVREGGSTAEQSSLHWETPIAIAATGDAGTFGPLIVPRDLVVTVTVEAPGHVREDREAAVPAEGPLPRLALELERGGVVTGTVRTPDGRPVPGATVNLLSGEHPHWVDTMDGPLDTRDTYGILAAVADERGGYRIDRVPLGGSFIALASAPGWLVSLPISPVIVTPDRPATTADPVLRRPARLIVRVAAPDGTAVRGATVVRFFFDGRRTSLQEIPESAEPGLHVLRDLRPGREEIGVSAAGFGPALGRVDILEGGAHSLELRLPAGVSITGIVLDHLGQPVERAWVSADREEWDDLALLTQDQPHPTDAAGRFEFRDLLRVPYLVTADAPIRSPTREECLTVTPPAQDLVIRLPPPRPVGTVRFRLRTPPGLSAPAELPYSLGAYNWRDGAFEMEEVEPGEGEFRFFPRGFAPLTVRYRVGGGEVADLGDIVLDEGAVLRGRVVDTDGRPVAGAVCILDQLQSWGDPGATAGEDGSFSIPHAARGDNRVLVRRDGFLRGDFTVPGERSGASPDLVLRRGGLLRVRVETAAGLPAPGCGVRFVLRGSPMPPTDCPYEGTDVRGRCEIRLPAGTWDASAGWDGVPAEAVLTEGSTVEIRLVVK